MTFQTRILSPSGSPLEATSVNFRFTVLDAAGTCVLYIEDFNSVNMTGSQGVVSFPLGSTGAVKQYPPAAISMFDVFNNSSGALSCQAGGTSTPSATDNRQIVMQFNDGSGWQTLPQMAVNGVPYAAYATRSEQLGDYAATAYLRPATLPSCTAGQALTWNGAVFTCMTAGSGGSVYTGVTSISNASGDITLAPAAGTNSVLINSNTASTTTSTGALIVTGGVGVSGAINTGSIITAGGAINTTSSVSAATSVYTPQLYGTSTPSGNIKVDGTSNATKGNVLLASTGGSVGIGTTSPAYALSVSGDINSSGNVISTGGFYTGGFVSAASSISSVTSMFAPQFYGTSTPSGNIRIDSTSNATKGNVLLAPTGGNVGIGTTSPAYALSVSGDVNVTGNFRVNGAVFSSGSGSLSSVSSISNASGDITLAPAVGTGAVQINSGAASTTTSTGALVVSGGLGVSGAINNGGNISSAGNISSSGSVSATSSVYTPQVYGTSTPSGDIRIDSTSNATKGNILLASTGGNVGVGTTSPAYALSVSGDISSTGDVIAGGFYTSGFVSAGSSISSATSMFAPQFYGTSTPSGDIRIDSTSNATKGNVLLAPTGGNVGIGTTSPTYALSVSGDVNVTGNFRVNGTVFSSGSGSLSSVSSIANASGDITLAPAVGTGAVQINSGVASTSPTTGALIVSGGIGTSGGIYTGGVVSSGSTVSAVTSMLSPQVYGTTTPSGNIKIDGTSDATKGNVLLASTGGNVGIGTTSPTYALSVSGDINSSGNVISTGGFYTSGFVSAGSSISSATSMFAPQFYGTSTPSGDIRIDSTSDATKGNVLLAPTGGNVGIGTTSPAYALSVSGDVNVTGNFRVNGAVFSGGNGSLSSVTSIANASGDITLAPAVGTGAVQINSGAASTSPTTGALIVSGGIGASGAIYTGGAISSGSTVSAVTSMLSPQVYGTSTPSGNIKIDGTSDATKGNVLLASTGGNVGIGTTSPAYALSVSGDVNVTGNFRVNGAVFSSGSGSLSSVSSIANASGDITLAPAVGTGAVQINSGVASTSSTTGALIVSGGIGVSGGIYTGGVVSSGSTVSAVTSMLSPQFYGTSTPSGNIKIDGTSDATKGNVLLASTGGNVGIGTASPGAPLDVKGAIRMSGSTSGYTGFQPAAAAGSTVWTLPTTDGSSGQVLSTNGSGVLSWATALTSSTGFLNGGNSFGAASSLGNSDNYDLSIKTNNTTRMTITNSGNVGIGTTTPGYPLHVYGTSATVKMEASAGSSLLKLQKSAGAANEASVNFQTGGTANYVIGTYGTPADFNFGTSLSSPQMTIQRTTGYVGIGTTSPTYALSVSGDVNVTGNFRVNGTILTSGGGGPTLTGITSIANASGDITLAPAVGTGAVQINSGVASTSSTTGALIVSGGIGVSGGIYTGGVVSSGSTVSAVTSMLSPQLYGTSTPSGNIKIDGTSDATKGNVLLASAGGYVGVGTTTPSSSLHVIGANGTTGNAPTAFTVTGGTGGTNGMGGSISMTAGTGAGTGVGGDVTIAAGAGSGSPSFSARGNMTISAGDSTGDTGGTTIVRAGNSTGSTGGLLTLGAGTSSSTGTISLATGAGTAVVGATGSLTLQTGTATMGSNAGSINLTGGGAATTGSGGAINITAGSGGATNVNGANVVINGGAKGGSGTDGNVLLASSRGSVGIGTTTPGAQLEVDPLTTSTIGIKVWAASGQSSYLQSWGKAGSGTIAYVSSGGAFYTFNSVTGNGVISTDSGGYSAVSMDGNNRLVSFTATGSSTVDTRIKRTAANTLTIDNGSSGSAHLIVVGSVAVGTTIPATAKLDVLQGTVGSTAAQVSNSGGTAFWKVVNPAGGAVTGWNAADAVVLVGKDASTSRSINAAGTVNATGADFAEWVDWSGPKPEMGSVIRYKGSYVVVSSPFTAAFIGNDVKDPKHAILVAFAGQLPVLVKGVVHEGDLIVAQEDGTAIAIPKNLATVQDSYKAVGTAWAASSDAGVKRVHVAVGIGLAGGQRDIASLKEENSQIKSDNAKLKQENEEIKARLDKIEKALKSK